MLTFKRLTGAFILVFLGIPILFGVIWGYGLSKAILSPDFISAIPQEFLTEIPSIVDDIADDAEKQWYTSDDETRAWLKAYQSSGADLPRLMRESGVETWIKTDLQNAFQEVGDMLRGERAFDNVDLNLIPLKTALSHPIIVDELTKIISHLPPCNEVENAWWQNRLEQTLANEDPMDLKMKACRPDDMSALPAALNHYLSAEIAQMPDTVEMIRVEDELPRGLNLTKWITQSMLILFVIPAFFIFLGALIGSDSRPSFFRWVGVPTLVGSGLVFLLTSTINRILPKLLLYDPDFQLEIRGYEFITPSLFSFVSSLGRHLFQHVNKMAMTISIIGIVIIALSYAFGDSSSNPSEAE